MVSLFGKQPLPTPDRCPCFACESPTAFCKKKPATVTLRFLSSSPDCTTLSPAFDTFNEVWAGEEVTLYLLPQENDACTDPGYGIWSSQGEEDAYVPMPVDDMSGYVGPQVDDGVESECMFAFVLYGSCDSWTLSLSNRLTEYPYEQGVEWTTISPPPVGDIQMYGECGTDGDGPLYLYIDNWDATDWTPCMRIKHGLGPHATICFRFEIEE